MRRILRVAVAFCLLLLLSPLILLAQERMISGKVFSKADNSPLPGVTVQVKGTNRATTTDINGAFSIAITPGQTLQFSYVGYETFETAPTGTTVTVTLGQSNSSLGEVVVTAYGIQRQKKSLGYSTQVVQGEDVAQTRRENFFNSLAGRVAGATVTSTSGMPGASSQIVLRGATSIGGVNQALIIVDGVPYDNQTLNQESLIGGQSISFVNRNSDYGNRAMDLNPEDIESVTVLKGPEAAALYGSDGAGGAIVITTRRGKAGRTSITYDNSFRFEKAYRFVEVQKEYTLGRNGIYDPNAVVNPYSILGTATGAGVNSAFGPRIEPGTPTYDNVKNFFNTGFTQQHNLNVEAGNENASYRFSTNFTDQSGVVPNTGYRKLSFRLTGSTKFGIARLTTSVNYVNSITDKASKGAGSYLLSLLTWPVESDVRNFANPDGSKIPIRNVTNYSLEYDNPLWDVNKNPAQDKVDRVTGNVNLSVDAAKWLKLANITGIDYYTQLGFLGTNPLSRFGYLSNGFYSSYSQTTRNLTNTTTATVNVPLGDFTNNLTLGFYVEQNNTKIEAIKGERFFERDFFGINNTDPTSRDAKTTVANVRRIRAFGTYTLGWKNLLFATVSGTQEGSSTFMSRVVDKDPYFKYGSASLAFSFVDVGGIKNALPWLNIGKARISYATTGKALYSPYNIDYRFTPQITTGGGLAYDVTGNNFDLKPERSKNLEYGVELAAWDNRIKLDVAAYSYRTKNQLLAARSSYGTGFVIKWFNGGEVENKGLEIQFSITPLKSKNLYWETMVNFATNNGTVLSMPADLPTYYDSDTWVFGNLRSQYFKGAKLGNMAANSYMRNNAGQVLISPTTGLPIRNNDFNTVGDRQPDFNVGLINKLNYKAWSLSFNLDFRKGGDVFNGTEFLLYTTGYSKRTLNRETPVVLDGVLQDGLENTANPTRNTISIVPQENSNFYYSTVATATEEDFIENVNWMRLRDITLSYQLPTKLLRNVKFIKSASVYFTGTDLFMITNYTGADPSVNANTASNRGYGGAGIDFGSLSTPRGFNFGCSIKF